MSKLPINEYLKEAFKRNKSSQVHKEVYKRGEELIRRCWKEDVFIVFTDGLRTMEDQAEIYGKGRSSFIYNGKQYGNRNAKVVSGAKPGYSMHNHGLAFDFVTCDGYGKNIDWSVGPKWRRAAAIAKELGFEWGGDWRNFFDAPHIEYNGGLTINQLVSGKMPVFKPFTTTKSAVTESEEIYMKPSNNTLSNEFEKFLVNARKEGYLSSDQWLVSYKIGKLSQSDALALVATVLNRKK